MERNRPRTHDWTYDGGGTANFVYNPVIIVVWSTNRVRCGTGKNHVFDVDGVPCQDAKISNGKGDC
jgi:hypothetical protein